MFLSLRNGRAQRRTDNGASSTSWFRHFGARAQRGAPGGLASHGGFRAFTAVFAALSLAAAASACSPGMFFGNNQDNGVANTPSYRKINTACSGLDLASSTIDVPTFRKLLGCFNSNGALEPIQRLIDRLNDTQLQPIVDIGNHYILNNKQMLYQLEQTQNALSDKGEFDNTLTQLGKLLENEEFVAASVALLKEGYFSQSGGLFSARTADQKLLRAIEQISQKTTPEKISEGIDIGLTLAGARAFQSLQSHFKGLSPAGRSLRDLTDQLLLFIQDNNDPHHVDAGKQLIANMINGYLFQALDDTLGTTSDQFRASVPRQSSFFRATLSNNGRIFDDMTSLFHYLHRPINCLRGTDSLPDQGAKQVPDGDMHVIRELARHTTDDASYFIRHDTPLILVALNSFCDFPQELGQYYGSMFSLAETTAMAPAADLLKAFFRIDPNHDDRHPLADLLVAILADTGSSAQDFPGGPPENTVGVKRLIPTLAELTDRGAWDDLLLVASLPTDSGRQDLVSALQFLTAPIPGMTESIYDVMTEAVSRATPESLYNLAYSMRRFVEQDQPMLVPALAGLRSAFYVNDVHPVIQLVHDIMQNATQNEPFFTTLFLISDMPEFQDSVKLVSNMAKNGQLKELIGSVITLFHKFALQGKTDIHATTEPAYVPHRRHDLMGSDLTAYPVAPVDPVPPVANSCRLLDTRILMSDYQNPAFEPQLTNFLACTNSDSQHGDVVSAVDFLRAQKTDSGESLFDLQIDLLKNLNLTQSELGYLADKWITTVDDGRFYHLLQALPFWVTNAYPDSAAPNAPKGPVLKPLFDLAQPIVAKAHDNLLELEKYGATVLRRPDIPNLLQFGDHLWDQKPEPQPAPFEQRYDLARLTRWVGNKECERFPPHATAGQVQDAELERAQEIESDYENAVTSWDLLLDGHVRTSWTFSEFHDLVAPLLTKLGDPAQSDPNHTLVDGMMNILRFFTLDNASQPANQLQHFSKDYLLQWLMDRSNDYRLISYFYPGESQPRVRLVNSLDRLELVLINADMYTPWILFDPIYHDNDPEHGCGFGQTCNVGMKFLAQIADAWGDEPRAVWPPEIQAKFPPGKTPQTLAQAVQDLLTVSNLFSQLMGFPQMPGCRQVANPNDPPEVQAAETTNPQTTLSMPSWLGGLIGGLDIPMVQAHLYNINQVTEVLQENLPGSGKPQAGGMKVLRDLFYQLYYSTPAQYRKASYSNPQDAWHNNLSVIMLLEKMGLTRQISRYLRVFSPDDPTLKDFFYGLIAGGTSPQVHQLLDPLLKDDPNHTLIFDVIQEVFHLIDASEYHDLDSIHLAEIQGKTPEQVEQIKAQWVAEQMRVKQMAYYLFAELAPLGIADNALKTIGPILHNYAGFLHQHMDALDSFLRSQRASWLTRALYESTDYENKARLADLLNNLLADPQHGLDLMAIVQAIEPPAGVKSAWSVFSDRMDSMTSLQEYQLLHVHDIAVQLLQFFEQTSTDPLANEAASKILHYAADRMESGDIDQLIRLAGNGNFDPQNPNLVIKDEFYQVFQTIASYTMPKAGEAESELQSFFDMVRHSLTEPPSR